MGCSASRVAPPDESAWHEFGGAELEPHLAATTIINVAWLLMFAKGEVMPERKGVVPAWQQLPPEATLDLATLRQTTMYGCLPVAVLSYGWAAADEPDPTGALLRQLVPVLERMVHSCEHGVNGDGRGNKPAAWGIVWDYMSLPQRGRTTGYDKDKDDRTPYELARFMKGLKSINVWYAHEYVTTLVCDWLMPEGALNSAPIERRGWCIFERRLSSVRKYSTCCLNLSGLAGVEGPYWFQLVDACKAGRFAPQAPDAFEAMLTAGMEREAAEAGSGFRFTNGKDATAICIPQYKEGFLRLMAKEGMLGFRDLGWGDAEVRELAAALAYAHAAGATTQADKLILNHNKLTDASVPVLVELLASGAVPKLKQLVVGYNKLSASAKEELRAAGKARGVRVYA